MTSAAPVDDTDKALILAALGACAAAVILLSRAVARLQRDVEFAVGAASAAVARETETS